MGSNGIDGFGAAATARLLERAVERTLEPHDLLFLAGDEPERVHLVERGVMKFIARDAEGEETIVGLALAGETVGEIAVLDGSVHPTDCAAATKALVLGIDAGLFLDVLLTDSGAALTVARILGGRLRWSSDTTIERAASEVPARLAGRLLGLAEMFGTHGRYGIDLELPLAQGDLGRLAGMCRESTCKAMSAFRKEGIVDYEGRRLRILRPDMLEHIKCAGRYRPEQKVSRAERV